MTGSQSDPHTNKDSIPIGQLYGHLSSDGECPICGMLAAHYHPEGWKLPKDLVMSEEPSGPTNTDIDELEQILRPYVEKLKQVAAAAMRGKAINPPQPNGLSLRDAVYAWADKQSAAREVAARLDELGKAAPHQVALYFEINQNELNKSWYLDYCVQRRHELEAHLTQQGVSDE
jgi:hypothetical protein